MDIIKYQDYFRHVVTGVGAFAFYEKKKKKRRAKMALCPHKPWPLLALVAMLLPIVCVNATFQQIRKQILNDTYILTPPSLPTDVYIQFHAQAVYNFDVTLQTITVMGLLRQWYVSG